jgi:hypothetical protein
MDKSDFVHAEYKALRDAVLNNFRLQLQVYATYASALLLFYGLMFRHGIYDMIMAIPIFSVALLFRILWHELIIRRVSEYIQIEIEQRKIPSLVGTINGHTSGESDYTNLWVGWQHFWKTKKWPRYFEYSRIMLFVLFSVVPALSYNVYCIVACFTDIPQVTRLHIVFHVILLIFNLSLGCYMWYRIKHISPIE